MSVVRAAARVCCLATFVMVTLALNNTARSEKYHIKYINVRQVLQDSKQGNTGSYTLGEQHQLVCHDMTCIGILPITLTHNTYYYETIAIILTDDPKYIRVSINLRPTSTGCAPRCQEPTLNSISTSIPSARQTHVTIPIEQFGDFPPTSLPGGPTDLVYRVGQEPVAYLDLSVELASQD